MTIGKQLLFSLAACGYLFAQDPVAITPYQLLTFDGASGQVTACSGCYIYTYLAGTSTPRVAYTDYTVATPLPNPIRTNTKGYAVATDGTTVTGIWVGTACYKMVAKDSNAVTIWTQDHICDQSQVLRALLATSAGAGMVGYAYPGGTVTTVAGALNILEYGNAIGYGADPTGTADSASAINACIAAGNSCFLPNGTYKTLSAISIIKPNFIFRCESRLTTIQYAGGAIFSPFLVGNGAPGVNNVTVQNCDVEGNASITGAAIYNNAGNTNTYDHVKASNAPIGILINNSILTRLDNPTVTGFGAVVPAVGIQIGGATGSGNGSTQTYITNPQIEAMTGATGIKITGDTAAVLTRSVGTFIYGGTVEGLALAIDATVQSANVVLDGLDIEGVSSGIAVRAAGGTLIITNGSFILGIVSVTATAANTTMQDSSAFRAIVAAGAVGTSFLRDSWDPGDANPTSTKYLVDAGTNTCFTGNYLGAGNVRQEDWCNGVYTDTSGRVNYMSLTGVNNAIVGTYTFSNATTVLPTPVTGTMIRGNLNGITLQAGANTFNGFGIGVKPISECSQLADLSSPYGVGSGHQIQLVRDVGNDIWCDLRQ